MDTNERSQVSDATREAEAEEALAPHLADRPPTQEEEDAVDGRQTDGEVRTHHQDMTRRGANEAGEGRIP